MNTIFWLGQYILPIQIKWPTERRINLNYWVASLQSSKLNNVVYNTCSYLNEACVCECVCVEMSGCVCVFVEMSEWVYVCVCVYT